MFPGRPAPAFQHPSVTKSGDSWSSIASAIRPLAATPAISNCGSPARTSRKQLPDHYRIIDNQYPRGHEAIPRPMICNLSRITSRVKGFITYSSAPCSKALRDLARLGLGRHHHNAHRVERRIRADPQQQLVAVHLGHVPVEQARPLTPATGGEHRSTLQAHFSPRPPLSPRLSKPSSETPAFRQNHRPPGLSSEHPLLRGENAVVTESRRPRKALCGSPERPRPSIN